MMKYDAEDVNLMPYVGLARWCVESFVKKVI